MTLKELPKAVQDMSRLRITGNIIPPMWYKNLRYKKSGRTHLPAIVILSEIVYWHRPKEVRDEKTGEVIAYEKRFKADKLQKSRKSFCEQFGLTMSQVRQGLGLLQDMEIITTEIRKVEGEITLSNVLYIDLNVKRLEEITYPESSSDGTSTIAGHEEPREGDTDPRLGHGDTIVGYPGPRVGDPEPTYTESTTENTTEGNSKKRKEREEPVPTVGTKGGADNASPCDISPNNSTDRKDKYLNKEGSSQLKNINLSREEKVDKFCLLVINDLNQKAGTSFEVDNHIRRLIVRLVKEHGHKIDDFRHVHTVKCDEWVGNSKMRGYLRPKTLYKPELFAEYLEQEEIFKESRSKELERIYRKAEGDFWKNKNPETLAAVMRAEKRFVDYYNLGLKNRLGYKYECKYNESYLNVRFDRSLYYQELKHQQKLYLKNMDKLDPKYNSEQIAKWKEKLTQVEAGYLYV